MKRRFLGLLLIVPLIAVPVYFLFFTAEYSTGFSLCGNGEFIARSEGFSRRASSESRDAINQKCPLDGSSTGSRQRLDTIFPKRAVVEFEGKGIVRVFIKKNGVTCEDKTISGDGKFTASVTCR